MAKGKNRRYPPFIKNPERRLGDAAAERLTKMREALEPPADRALRNVQSTYPDNDPVQPFGSVPFGSEGFALGDPDKGVALGDPSTRVAIGQPPANGADSVRDKAFGPRQVPAKQKRIAIRIRDRQLLAVHARALITALEEVEAYDPQLHHNRLRPMLWTNDRDYLDNIKQLLHELRRFNDLLETAVDLTALEKSGGLIAKCAEKFVLSAATVAGVGVGGLFMASVYGMLSHFESGKEVLQHIPLVGKSK